MLSVARALIVIVVLRGTEPAAGLVIETAGGVVSEEGTLFETETDNIDDAPVLPAAS